MKENGPSIGEVVNFLDWINSNELGRLRESFPVLKDELRAGGSAAVRDALLEPRVQVCLAALEEAINWCTKGAEVTGGRLRRARRLGLAAGVSAIVGSSSVLATVAAESKFVTIVSGLIALAGSVLTFVADFTTRPAQGEKGTLFDTYQQLLEGTYQAKRLRGELSAHLDAGITPRRESEVSGLIGESNALCLTLIKLAGSVSV